MFVSVIMPVYNAEKFVAEAIESVLQQTHSNFELIAINDGSADDSLSIIKRYAKNDKRIQVYTQDNCGVGLTRNRCVELSSAEWVFCIDADDVMLPHRIESQINFIKSNHDVRICSCRAYYINEVGRILGKTVNSIRNRNHFYWYLKNNEAIGILSPGATMHRETIIKLGGYRGQFWPAEDIDLWNRVAEKGHLILVQDEILMKYRIHSGSIITSKFMEGRLQYEWVRACMWARRSGKPEPTRDEFISQWKNRPLFERINWRRKTYAKKLYRQAGFDLTCSNLSLATGRIFLSAILQPSYVVPRLISQLLWERN